MGEFPSVYHLAVQARRAEIGLRFGFCVLIALTAAQASRSWWPIVWLGAVGAAQFANLLVGKAAIGDARFSPSPLWELRYLAVQSLNSAAFVAIGPFLWFSCGPEGRLISMVVLMGGLLNFGTQPYTSGRLLWSGSLPYAAMLGGLPLATVLVEPGVSPFLMGSLTAGAALYLLHVLKAVRRRDEAVVASSRALQRAEEESAAKSTFLATMSHEIRTPLNGVLGMAQAMEADSLSEVQRSRLGVIRQSGGLLLTLLNDLLDLAKIEASRFELEDGWLDVADLATEAREAFAPLAAERGLSLSVTAAPEALGVWRADPTRVRQILYNLLSNAVKFTSRGEVAALIDLAPDGRWRITVRDTGDGISPEDQARLFGRFIQVDASTTRRFGGTGLGLAISHELARLMGGDLTVSSRLGEGSNFELVLPLVRSQAPNLEVQAVSASVEGLRVLVAEDNETNRLVISALLEQLGVSAQFASDGAEAVAAWRSAAWDLVLMDIQMPVMDGREATRRIRRLEEGGPGRTPIVALTANAMRHQIEEYRRDGFDAVAPKPIQVPVLLAAMDEAMAAASEACLQPV